MNKKNHLLVFTFLLFLVGCSPTSVHSTRLQDELNVLRQNYSSRIDSAEQPTTKVSSYYVDENKDLYQFSKTHFQKYKILGQSWRIGEVTADNAIEELAKQVGADIVLKQHKFSHSAEMPYQKDSTITKEHDISLNEFPNKTISGKIRTTTKSKEISSYSTNIYSAKFIFLKGSPSSKATADMKATDFNITSAENPYNGVWESEFYEIIIHTTPDNYVAFVQNYYGMKQLQEAYKKGDLFFLVNKSNLSGKQYERSSSLTKDYKISDLKIQLKNSTALEIIYPYLGREHRVKFYKAQ